MQLAPGPARLSAALLDLLPAYAAELQADGSHLKPEELALKTRLRGWRPLSLPDGTGRRAPSTCGTEAAMARDKHSVPVIKPQW